MSMQDNVPDPRFAPPDDRRFRPPDDTRDRGTTRLRLILLLIGLSMYVVPQWLQWQRVRGWVAAGVAVVLFALAIGQFVLHRVVAERENDDFPYSRPSNITR